MSKIEVSLKMLIVDILRGIRGLYYNYRVGIFVRNNK